MNDFKDDTVYDPSMSMGGVNAYAHDCHIVGSRPGYCICLHKVAAVERNDVKNVSANCQRAISFGSCPALKLRSEERAAGKALYFIHREKLRAHNEARIAEARAAAPQWQPKSGAAKSTTGSASKPSNRPEPKEHFITEPGTAGGTYADAINAAIREAQAPKQTVWDGPAAPDFSKPAPSASPAPAAAPLAPTPASQPASAPVAVKAGMSLIELARAKLAAQQTQPQTAKEQ